MERITGAQISSFVEKVRKKNPLVQCITNYVAMPWTANVLIAGGMSPAMIVDENESGVFASIADATLINIGTLSIAMQQTILVAIETTRQLNKPWVFDPVAANPVFSWRYQFSKDVLTYRPTVIRGNASEIVSLSGAEGIHSRGVDSLIDVEDALEAAVLLAKRWQIIVIVTGACDYITDGERIISVPLNIPELTLITATGCALSAVVSGFIGSVSPDDYLEAAAAACGFMAVAGGIARKNSKGPGSLAVEVLDQLKLLDIRSIEGYYSEATKI